MKNETCTSITKFLERVDERFMIEHLLYHEEWIVTRVFIYITIHPITNKSWFVRTVMFFKFKFYINFCALYTIILVCYWYWTSTLLSILSSSWCSIIITSSFVLKWILKFWCQESELVYKQNMRVKLKWNWCGVNSNLRLL